MKRLYVVGDQPVRIPGYGSKAPGEYFELETDALAEAYAEEHEGLSLASTTGVAEVAVSEARDERAARTSRTRPMPPPPPEEFAPGAESKEGK